MLMHILLSRLSIILLLLLAMNYPFRKICAKYRLTKEHPLKKAHQWLQKQHKLLGFASIAVVFAHCHIAEQATGSQSAIGHGLIFLLISLALTWLLRKFLKKCWMFIHRILAAILLILSICHAFLKF